MEWLIWPVIMIPVSAGFTLGIYAWHRKAPMWFWSGSSVSEDEITDVPAYNRANGIMWIAFSAIFWFSTFLGLLNLEAAGIFLIAGCIIGVIGLFIAYGKIYAKYHFL
ncbi:MAG: hypothetical protein IKE43_01425 [Coriobacteriales bacterium]|nr:hypothetical protein [Coriobacteriales bacterium]